MSAVEQSYISCGVFEISVLHPDPAKILSSIKEEWQITNDEGDCAFAMFSDVVKREPSNGHKLADFIKKNHLGSVHKSANKRNPNTESTICVWLWDVNRRNLHKWFINNGLDKEYTSSFRW